MKKQSRIEYPLDPDGTFTPKPVDGYYDHQISAVWQAQLAELSSKGLPLLAIMDVLYALTARFHHTALKPLGFTHIEYAILSTALFNEHGVKPTVLTKVVGKGTSGTSQALRKLEKNGYIYRSEEANDKRSILVHLTDKGKQIAYELCKAESALSEKVFATVDDANMERYRDAIRELIYLMKEA